MNDLYPTSTPTDIDMEHDRLCDRTSFLGQRGTYPRWVDERDGTKHWERPGDPTGVDSDGFGYSGESCDWD